MAKISVPTLTENQAYAKALEFQSVFNVFKNVSEVFQASDEAKKTLENTKRSLVPVRAETVQLEANKKQAEQDLIDLNTNWEKRKKQIDVDESIRKAAYHQNIAKWDNAIKDKEDHYNTEIKVKSKELKDLIAKNNKILERQEVRIAAIKKEYSEFEKLVITGA